MESKLDVDTRNSSKLKFLIDTGAEISIIKGPSINSEVKYQLHKGIDIKGIVMVF